MSGLKVNWDRSSLRGINIYLQKVALIATKWNCKTEQLPIMYLGLPLGGNPKLEVFWIPIKDKILKKLDRWKMYQLCRGGRLTVTQAVLGSIPLYYLSLYQMPGYIKNSGKIQASYQNQTRS